MIRVTVELLDERRHLLAGRVLAVFDVFNTGEGDATHGHYAVAGRDGDRALRRASIGLLKRNATGPLALTARALHALGYVVPEPPKDTDVGRCEARFREWLDQQTVSMSDAEVEVVVAEIFGKEKTR